MIISNKEEEDFIFSTDSDTAIPITIRKVYGKDVDIEVFGSYADFAAEFIQKYNENPTSQEALAFIWDRVGDSMRKRGYNDEKGRDRYYYTYVIKSDSEIPESVFLPSTVEMTKKSIRFCKNLTTFDLKTYIKDGLSSFITVDNGKIVSIAAENIAFSNDFRDECSIITEIGVETNINYRKKGYASSNAASLAAKILRDTGGYVTYETENTNISSQMCAEKAGFKKYGECYYYVMRKIY